MKYNMCIGSLFRMTKFLIPQLIIAKFLIISYGILLHPVAIARIRKQPSDEIELSLEII